MLPQRTRTLLKGEIRRKWLVIPMLMEGRIASIATVDCPLTRMEIIKEVVDFYAFFRVIW